MTDTSAPAPVPAPAPTPAPDKAPGVAKNDANTDFSKAITRAWQGGVAGKKTDWLIIPIERIYKNVCAVHIIYFA